MTENEKTEAALFADIGQLKEDWYAAMYQYMEYGDWNAGVRANEIQAQIDTLEATLYGEE